MDKKTKKIAGIAAIAVLIVLIIIVCVVMFNKGVTNNETTTLNKENVTSGTATQAADKKSDKDKANKSDEELPTFEQVTEKKDNNKDPFKDVEIYEETTKKGKTKKNKKEAYPGENDGWSPIVSPDDLEQ